MQQGATLLHCPKCTYVTPDPKSLANHATDAHGPNAKAKKQKGTPTMRRNYWDRNRGAAGGPGPTIGHTTAGPRDPEPLTLIDFITPHADITCLKCGLAPASPLTNLCPTCDPILQPAAVRKRHFGVGMTTGDTPTSFQQVANDSMRPSQGSDDDPMGPPPDDARIIILHEGEYEASPIPIGPDALRIARAASATPLVGHSNVLLLSRTTGWPVEETPPKTTNGIAILGPDGEPIIPEFLRRPTNPVLTDDTHHRLSK